MTVKLSAAAAPAYSLASQQNSYPLFTDLALALEADSAALDADEVKVTLRADPPVFDEAAWQLSAPRPGQRITFTDRQPRLSAMALEEVAEQVTAELILEASVGDAVVDRARITTELLPRNHWGGEQRMPELLAAYVTPNSAHVATLLNAATALLKDHGGALDGYQSRTRDRPYLMMNALWNVVARQGYAYVNPPPSFATQGQKIRLPDQIGATRMGACLDLSVLFAACLEAMGLNPLIVLTKGHAIAGAWLLDETMPTIANADAMDIRKRVASQDMVMFETTMVTGNSGAGFRQACESADRLLAADKEEDFVLSIDIALARKNQVRPLPEPGAAPTAVAARTDGQPVALELPEPPAMPPIRPEELAPPETPDGRVDHWQRKLLDLSRRNRLLNLADRTAAIKIICPDIAGLEDRLAQKETFKFVAEEEVGSAILGREDQQLATDQARGLLEEKKLLARGSTKDKDRNLLNLYRKAKNDLQEGGSNTLYLAIGMLRWKENPQADRTSRAPLILQPVELTRSSASAPIRIKAFAAEEPIFNSTLIEFLRKDHEIELGMFADELPTDDSGIDVQKVWDTVRALVKDTPGFEVVEELVLSTFSFAKYLMWKDIKDRLGQLKENQFVNHLIEKPHASYPQQGDFVADDEVDQRIPPTELFAPLNADSSQIVAIEASGKPQDFVLEGPPGTGKSETIANLIAHNLALGRRVLFVAEKMAALNVVHDRLKRCGLEALTLELHSNKAAKPAVYAQLRQAWERTRIRRDDWEEQARALGQMRRELNDYVKALHAMTEYGVTVSDVITSAAANRNHQGLQLDWNCDLEHAPVTDEAGVRRLLAAAVEFGEAHADMDGSTAGLELVKHDEYSHAWQENLVAAAQDLKDRLTTFMALVNGFGEQLDIDLPPPAFTDLGLLADLAAMVIEVDQETGKVIVDDQPEKPLADLARLADLKQLVEDEGQGVDFTGLKNWPVVEWLEALRATQEQFFLFAWLAKRKVRQGMAAKGMAPTLETAEIERLVKMQETMREIDKLAATLAVKEGMHIPAQDLRQRHQEWDRAAKAVRRFAAWAGDPGEVLRKLEKVFGAGREFITTGSPLLDVARELIEVIPGLREAAKEFASQSGGLAKATLVHALVTPLGDLLDNAGRLRRWCALLSARNLTQEAGLATLEAAVNEGKVKTSDCASAAKAALYRWLAPRLIDRDAALRKFRAQSHERRIVQFRECDAEVAKSTSRHILAMAGRRLPKPGSRDAPAQFSVLAHELGKKMRHKPIRKLFSEMGDCLLDLTPCMLMSPLSVSQYLPADFRGFDLVVFDEASQITVWDAVGAIARGKNVIVVGDPKQMPPTNFFSRNSGEEDDDDYADLESILDQALAANLHHHRLTGHYRSKHESLIAFSNSKYYDNSLVTFPSAVTKASAVTLHRVDGLYHKGKGRNNVIEANAVADEVLRRLRDPALRDLSIGIVTLNTEQQRTVEDALDERRRQHIEIEKHFNDTTEAPVFVKNLESVQGDERDVIMLSLGYGPTEPGARTMSMNFGPLNRPGGERRLNVAITRATTEVLVFSSFDPEMIDLSRTKATAVAHLQHYLKFARNGPAELAAIATAEHGVDQFDSPFEQEVANELRQRGWKVQTQVGVSKFRVDLGIVHPDHPGDYLAGVECDGATYHGSPCARDRDRVRQIILENLGWKLVRLWSTDYFNDPGRAINRVNNHLVKLLQSNRENSKTKKQLSKPVSSKNLQNASNQVLASEDAS